MSEKRLEIFHYATFEEMEADKRRRQLARTPRERFYGMLTLIRLCFRLSAPDKTPHREGITILPQRIREHL
jgi:hypothetical protein